MKMVRGRQLCGTRPICVPVRFRNLCAFWELGLEYDFKCFFYTFLSNEVASPVLPSLIQVTKYCRLCGSTDCANLFRMNFHFYQGCGLGRFS